MAKKTAKGPSATPVVSLPFNIHYLSTLHMPALVGVTVLAARASAAGLSPEFEKVELLPARPEDLGASGAEFIFIVPGRVPVPSSAQRPAPGRCLCPGLGASWCGVL